MTNKQTLDDLTYLRDMASAGQNAPLVGGSIGLLWGVLLTIVFAAQWLIMSGKAGIAEQNLLFVWLAFAIIGGAGTALLSRRIDGKPGAGSTANQVGNHIWVMFGGMMATLFIGVMLSNYLGQGTPALFDFMVVAGFAGQALPYGVIARVSNSAFLKGVAFAAFTASAICFTAFGTVNLYLIAAIGTLFTVVWPSLASMRQEPSNVV